LYGVIRMDPEELNKQFKEMESDSHVQAAAAGVPPVPPVRRRITTAQLKKDLDDLESYIENEVLAWCGQLDSRLDKIEHEEEPRTTQALAYLQTQVDALDKSMEILSGNNSALMKSYLALQEEMEQTTSPEATADITNRLDTLEMATRVLADAIRDAVESAEPATPAEPARREFDKQPIPMPELQAQPGDIAAVASVCVSMNDVLMITRALKESRSLSDMERNEILNIACQSADVQVTHGLQIRAGVHDGAA